MLRKILRGGHLISFQKKLGSFSRWSWLPLTFAAMSIYQNCSPGGFKTEISSSTPQNGALSAASNGTTCDFNGITLQNNQQITAFLSNVSAATTPCLPEVRTCINGQLTGTYSFAVCGPDSGPGPTVPPTPPPTPPPPPALKNCTLDGMTINSGSNLIAFDSRIVSPGKLCSSQVRNCLDGVLDGPLSFQYTGCLPLKGVNAFETALPKTTTAPPKISASAIEGYQVNSTGTVVSYGSASVLNGVTKIQANAVSGADVATFRGLNNFLSASPGSYTRSNLFATDLNGVYCAGVLLAGISASTFYIVDGIGFYSNQAYDSTCKPLTVNTIQEFWFMNSGYAMDSINTYSITNSNRESMLKIQVMAGVDRASFSVLSARFAKDLNNIYDYGTPHPVATANLLYIRDDFYSLDSNLFCGSNPPTFIDIGTLVQIKNAFIADAYRLFVCNANGGLATFTGITSPTKFRLYPLYDSQYSDSGSDYGYGQDGSFVYFLDRFSNTVTKLPASLNTFHPIDQSVTLGLYGSYGIDGSTVYFEDQISMTGVDNASFVLLNEYFAKDANAYYSKISWSYFPVYNAVAGIAPSDIVNTQIIPYKMSSGSTADIHFSYFLKSNTKVFFGPQEMIGVNPNSTFKFCDWLNGRTIVNYNGVDSCYLAANKVDCVPSASSKTNTTFNYLGPNVCY